jgi:hypothetical protein
VCTVSLNGDDRGARTHDKVINSHLLYQLSYIVKNGWHTLTGVPAVSTSLELPAHG